MDGYREEFAEWHAFGISEMAASTGQWDVIKRFAT